MHLSTATVARGGDVGHLVRAGKAAGLPARWRRLLEVAEKRLPQLDEGLQRSVVARLNPLVEVDHVGADLARWAIEQSSFGTPARGVLRDAIRSARFRLNMVTDDSPAARLIREWERERR